MLNVNCIKIHSIILSVTCHGLRNFPLLIHIPSKPFMNFWNPMSYYFWVRVTHKMLNVNCIKIHSIILSVTCHGLRNFPLLIHIPFISICEFLKPCELLFFELESLIKCWMWIGKNSLNNFICHLSWLKKLSPTHTHPLKTICEFLKPYELLFFELESLVKCWMWIGKKFTQ